MLQHSEFALHDFGSFEFGRESRTLVHPLDFGSMGSSNAFAEGMAYANTKQEILAASDVAFVGNTVVLLVAEAEGGSVFDPPFSLVLLSNYGIPGGSSATFPSGFKTGVTFWGGGVSEVDFQYFEGNEFHIRPFSQFIGLTTPLSHLNFDILSTADSKMVASAVANARGVSESAVIAEIHAQRLTNVGLSSYSQSAAAFHFQRVRLGAFELTGEAHSDLHAQIVKNHPFRANGSTGLLLPADFKTLHDTSTEIEAYSFAYFSVFLKRILAANFSGQGLGNLSGSTELKVFHPSVFAGQAGALFDALGDTKVFLPSDFKGQGYPEFLGRISLVHVLDFESFNSSEAIWYRGRNTLPFILPSYVVFVRPEENRTLVWKE